MISGVCIFGFVLIVWMLGMDGFVLVEVLLVVELGEVIVIDCCGDLCYVCFGLIIVMVVC